MKRSETFRREFVASGDPLRNHSLNQKRIKGYQEQMRGGQIPLRVVKSEIRRARAEEEKRQHDEAKTTRIRERVEAVLAGYVGFSPEVFRAELVYLRRFGIVYERFEGVN